jgi:hypothetical protein
LESDAKKNIEEIDEDIKEGKQNLGKDKLVLFSSMCGPFCVF